MCFRFLQDPTEASYEAIHVTHINTRQLMEILKVVGTSCTYFFSDIVLGKCQASGELFPPLPRSCSFCRNRALAFRSLSRPTLSIQLCQNFTQWPIYRTINNMPKSSERNTNSSAKPNKFIRSTIGRYPYHANFEGLYEFIQTCTRLKHKLEFCISDPSALMASWLSESIALSFRKRHFFLLYYSGNIQL